MSQSFDAASGWPSAPMPERDRSQMPLWPELESELELALAAQGDVASSHPVYAATECSLGMPPVIALDTAGPESTPAFGIAEDAGEYSIVPPSVTEQTASPLFTGEHRLDARAEAFPDADRELGHRLRAARERAELGRDEIATRTRIAPALIQAIEEGRFERLGATVFARGYLRSYARAVELPDAVVSVWEGRVHRVLEDAPAPSLAATSPRRSSRQVASPIVYTLLTALIAVPAYYGVRQAQQSPLPRASVSAPATASQSSVTAASTGVTTGAERPSVLTPEGARKNLKATNDAAQKADAWRQPVMASLTPMLGNSSEFEAAPAPLALRQVEVRLRAPSWVEIIANDGRVIERSLLPAGSVREYAVPRSAQLRFGDAGVVELRADGEVIDLKPYTQANVATLTLDEAG